MAKHCAHAPCRSSSRRSASASFLRSRDASSTTRLGRRLLCATSRIDFCKQINFSKATNKILTLLFFVAFALAPPHREPAPQQALRLKVPSRTFVRESARARHLSRKVYFFALAHCHNYRQTDQTLVIVRVIACASRIESIILIDLKDFIYQKMINIKKQTCSDFTAL